MADNLALRRAMKRLNVSQEELARRIREDGRDTAGCNRAMVYRWLRGITKCPQPRYLRALERVTGLPAASLGFADGVLDLPGAQAARLAADIVPSGSIALPFAWQSNVRAGNRAPVVARLDGQAPLEYLETARSQHVIGDRLFGPRHVLPGVLSHLVLVQQLMSASRGHDRRALTEIGIRYAELVGWLFQDLGDASAAALWSDRALEWATEADRPVLVSYVLFRKATQAADEGDISRLLSLAEAARRGYPAVPRQITALALRQEAYGHALDRNERACNDSLDRALELAAAARADADQGPGKYCDEPYIESMRGRCWIELGQPQKAIPLLERHLESWPEHQKRDRGVASAVLALAHAHAEQPEHAAAHAREAMTTAVVSGSRRIAADLAQLTSALTTWRGMPEVESVHLALRDLGIPGPSPPSG